MKKILTAALMIMALAAGAQNVKHCKGTKKDGTACGGVIINKDGYCRMHDPNAVHCHGTNAKGKSCGMVVKSGQSYCRFHKK